MTFVERTSALLVGPIGRSRLERLSKPVDPALVPDEDYTDEEWGNADRRQTIVQVDYVYVVEPGTDDSEPTEWTVKPA